MTTKTDKQVASVTVPPTFAQPLEMLGGLFQALSQIQVGTGCLTGSMPITLRAIAHKLRMGQLTAVEARSYFTSCASFLQQHLSGILWKGYHKQTGGPHEGPFEVDSRTLECLQKMSEPLQTMAGLIAPYEFERPDPKISHLLNKSVESLVKVCEERSLGSYHTALSILVVAFIELSLAV